MISEKSEKMKNPEIALERGRNVLVLLCRHFQPSVYSRPFQEACPGFILTNSFRFFEGCKTCQLSCFWQAAAKLNTNNREIPLIDTSEVFRQNTAPETLQVFVTLTPQTIVRDFEGFRFLYNLFNYEDAAVCGRLQRYNPSGATCTIRLVSVKAQKSPAWDTKKKCGSKWDSASYEKSFPYCFFHSLKIHFSNVIVFAPGKEINCLYGTLSNLSLILITVIVPKRPITNKLKRSSVYGSYSALFTRSFTKSNLFFFS